MKHWKKLLRQIALIACIGMLAGCGSKEVTETPMETPVPTQTEVSGTDSNTETDHYVEATKAPVATETPAVTEVPDVIEVPDVMEEPVATEAPKATATPVPTKAPATPAATATPAPTKAPASNTKKLTGADAFEITSQMIVGWNLGNSLDANGGHISYNDPPAKAVTSWHNEEPTREMIEAVKAAGFNTVRIPTTWYNHIKLDNTTGTYTINQEWLDYVKTVVDYAYELDMFVILNVHHENWVNVAEFTDETYAKASRILTDIWTVVAATFADYDQHLIFEGMNEPRQTGLGSSVEWGTGDTYSRKYINDLNKVFIDTVRSQGSAANAERLLMLPGYCASSDKSVIRSINVPEGSGNVALSVHAYYPYFFAMAPETDSKANHSFPGKSGYGENYETSITNFFKDLKAIMKEKNVPIIIGETGASDYNNNADRERWAKHFFGCAKEAGVPCVYWDNQGTYNPDGEGFGLLHRATCKWFENAVPMLKAVMELYGQESSLPSYKPATAEGFNWADIPIEKDWVEIFRAENGQKVETWGNIAVSNWQPYMNENYEFVLVCYSTGDPYMVLQGGWHKVYSTKASTNQYLVRFTFDDIQTTVKNENVDLAAVYNFFISADAKPMTAYGLYAVPAK